MNERPRYAENPSLYWIGPDISTKRKVIIDSNGLILPVTITPESLPSMFRKRPEYLKGFGVSMRSRYAQLGLDTYEVLTQQIAIALVETGSQDMNGNVTKPFTVDVLVFNNSQRSVNLKEGSRIFRLFNKWERPLARGKEIVRLLESGQVELKGDFGKDWSWSYAYSQEGNMQEIIGINVRIDDRNRRWIPPLDHDDTPIEIDDKRKDYRNSIEEMFVEVPEREEKIFWVGETTPEIVLRPTVDAIIDKAVLPDISGKINFNQMGVHAQSHLLEGGQTNWRVRVEVKSPTVRKKMPNAITLYLAPKQKAI